MLQVSVLHQTSHFLTGRLSFLWPTWTSLTLLAPSCPSVLLDCPSETSPRRAAWLARCAHTSPVCPFPDNIYTYPATICKMTEHDVPQSRSCAALHFRSSTFCGLKALPGALSHSSLQRR